MDAEEPEGCTRRRRTVEPLTDAGIAAAASDTSPAKQRIDDVAAAVLRST